MGVGVAENHKPEVLQTTDTNVPMTTQDLKYLAAACQETDENLEVTDREIINEEDSRQPWLSMATLLANHDFVSSSRDAGEEDNVFLDVLTMLPGGPDHLAKSIDLSVDADGILIDRGAIDRTKQDIINLMMPSTIEGVEFAHFTSDKECVDGPVIVDLDADVTPANRGLCLEQQMPDFAADNECKDETAAISARPSSADSVSARNKSPAPALPEGPTPSTDVQSKTKYAVAQRVAYWSDTHQTWMQAVVKKINLDRNGQLRSYDLDVKNGAVERKITNLPAELESVSSEKKLAAEESAGALHKPEKSGSQRDNLEVKSSCASTCDTNTRPPFSNHEGPDVEFVVGDLVEYWSLTYKQWMAAVVESVGGEGFYDLDVKRSAQKNRIRKRAMNSVAVVAEQAGDVSGAVSGSSSVQIGCPGPARRSSCSEASAVQGAVVEKGAAQSFSPAPNQAVSKQSVDPAAAALAGMLPGTADMLFPRTQSPMSGRMRSSVCAVIPGSQYAHRTVSSNPTDQLPPRSSSPISSRTRGLSLDQPLDVVAGDLNIAASPPARKLGTSQPQAVARSIGANSYASPVLRNRCVIGDAVANRVAPQPLQSGLAAPPARCAGVESMMKQREGAADKVIVRQTTGGTSGGAEKNASLPAPIAASNVYRKCARTAENAPVVRTGGGQVYANTPGPSTGAYYMTTSATGAAAIRARSRSTGRNSLVPERISQDVAATPAICTMQAHGSARQFAAARPGVGAQTPGTPGCRRQLEMEDLTVGDGQFDPSQPSVRSQLVAKLHLQADAEVEEMAGFRGGLNDGVWFLGKSLVLKLVKGRRQHDTMPTEAESCVKLSQDFPGIGSDASISFPLSIFRCIRPDGSKLHDLIVMTRAPGVRLAEITACKYHGKEVASLLTVFEHVGRLLREFHGRYGNTQHGDFQPSNIMVDEETGKITMIDVAGMETTNNDTDLEHFRLSMDILAKSYGKPIMDSCMQHLKTGYGTR